MSERTVKTDPAVVELLRLVVLVAGALAFAYVGNETLASTALGGALALLVPRPAGTPAAGVPLALGLACGAAVPYLIGGAL